LKTSPLKEDKLRRLIVTNKHISLLKTSPLKEDRLRRLIVTNKQISLLKTSPLKEDRLRRLFGTNLFSKEDNLLTCDWGEIWRLF
jgi:hypothetical protein